MGPIRIVPFVFTEREEVLAVLVRRLERRFRTRTVLAPPAFDPDASFSADRGQYHSTRILGALLAQSLAADGAVLGVTSVDLFLPVLTYVFGEAQLGGRAAVVSCRRLDNRVYGLAPSEPLLVDRLEKEANHELGHTRGLVHCGDATCVMASSTYVGDIDLKRPDFCDDCWGGLALER